MSIMWSSPVWWAINSNNRSGCQKEADVALLPLCQKCLFEAEAQSETLAPCVFLGDGGPSALLSQAHPVSRACGLDGS